MVDKNKAMIDYLLTCPYLKPFSKFFNFGKAEDNNKQFITHAADNSTNETYIDGSEKKIYSITIIDFKSVGYNAIIEDEPDKDENLSEMLEAQQIIDWINKQEKDKNYPDFGSSNEVEKISATSEMPNIDGIDTTVTPALVLYSVKINVEYLDTSKVIWN